jgi:predicted transposase/invertase (TIGR01784 family)
VKTEQQLETELDKWLYILKNISILKEIPVCMRSSPVFEKLFTIAEYGNLTKEEKMKYDSSMKYKWDNENVLDYALSEGEKRGRIEGLAEGERNGERKSLVAVARAMKKEGFTPDQIAKFTQLSVEEIERL